MVTQQELIGLFSKLASQLQTQNPSQQENETIDLTVSNLTQSLNLKEGQNGNSTTRVLDTALSLMCFNAPQVYDRMIEFTVKTIITVLNCSISCKVIRFKNEEALQVGGSSVSCYDCVELIEACVDVIGKLEGDGTLPNLLLYFVLRVVASASCYRYVVPSLLIYDVKSIAETERRIAVSKLLFHLPIEAQHKSNALPLRLLGWYLDPVTLKNDVSKILQDTMVRPFLSLDKEFHQRMEWQSIVTCLVLSPTMFIETRILLHNWFLATGLTSVLELLNALVSVILDFISRPTWWSIPVEAGTKLPSSKAYFPYKSHLLRILDGPLISERVIHIVHTITKPVSRARGHLDPSAEQSSTDGAKIDHRSSWAMAMNFPEWFIFACILLFSERKFQEDFTSKCTLGAPKTELDNKIPFAAAARYIAWILNPISQSNQAMLGDILIEISESWSLKHSANMHKKEATGYRKKLKKPKYPDNEDHTSLKDYDCQTILLWLNKFQSSCMRFWDRNIHHSKSLQGLALQKNLLYRRIPLGILVGCSENISAEGCELLLHYAATGRILEQKKTQSAGLKHRKQNSEWSKGSVYSIKDLNRKEALAGACLAFQLTDVAEKMSASVFETEESGLDFICQVKARVFAYLMKCCKKLLELKFDEDDYGAVMLMDLGNRLVLWKHQGRELPGIHNDLDDIISDLNFKSSSL